MDGHSQDDEGFGMSFVSLEGWDWGMQSTELQDHPAGSRISSLGYYRLCPRFPERARANTGFEKQLQISLLGNKETAPVLL